jgi:hypothetical protein
MPYPPPVLSLGDPLLQPETTIFSSLYHPAAEEVETVHLPPDWLYQANRKYTIRQHLAIQINVTVARRKRNRTLGSRHSRYAWDPWGARSTTNDRAFGCLVEKSIASYNFALIGTVPHFLAIKATNKSPRAGEDLIVFDKGYWFTTRVV